MNKKKTTYRRLSIEQRIKLVIEINKRELSSAVICAQKLNVSRQAIYDEIKNHFSDGGPPYQRNIPCSHSGVCLKSGKNRYCFQTNCLEYEEMLCPKLGKFPFVCNKCDCISNSRCGFRKRYYDPNDSHDEALDLRVKARIKSRLEDENIIKINELISPLIKDNRLSLHHAYVTHQDEINYCERTVRRLIYQGVFDAKAHHLPMFNAFQKRNTSVKVTRGQARNYELLEERLYGDYRAYRKSNPEVTTIQLDSVIGKINDRLALMTIYHPDTHFMFGFMYSKGNAMSFLNRLISLRKLIGANKFYEIFPIVLTDNGIEMVKLPEIEFDEETGEQRCRVFYTDPYNSAQKGAIEKNHVYLRRILTKGKSLNNVSQDFINNAFSHINSIVRESLNNKTPYDLFTKRYGVDVVAKLGINKISPHLVNLYQAKFYS